MLAPLFYCQRSGLLPRHQRAGLPPYCPQAGLVQLRFLIGRSRCCWTGGPIRLCYPQQRQLCYPQQ